VNARFYEFNFNQPEHVLAWLSKEEDRWPESELPLSEGLQKKSRDMSITASFRIKTSLIVRSYSSRSEEPDAIHIRSNGKNIMPGTSIKGALRGRASRILNTMGAADDLLIKDMFGWVDDELPGKNTAIRGRFLVEETVIDNVLSSIRSRVRIDRFTGGASSGALFDNKPLWPKDGEKIKMVELKLTLKEYQDWEAGLVLMLLKDLWTGDLPLGGEKSIGRGVLQGIDAQINVGDNRYSLKDIDGHKFIFEGNPEELEGLAAALQSKISCQGVAANG
jgi:CRISPR/Cas system CSM-associated protein Csm3 (group 7 of RAMP superfamily)